MSESLYAQANEIEYAVDACIDRETGEVTDEALAANLDELMSQGKEKILACGLFYRGLELESEKLKAEIDRLKKRKALHDRQAEKFKSYISRHAERFNGQETVKNELITISWRKSPGRVEVEVEPWNLDAAFQRIEIKADRAKIADALRAGDLVEGAKLVKETKMSIK